MQRERHGRKIGGQCFHSVLSVQFLEEGEDGIEHDHTHDRGSENRRTAHDGEGGGGGQEESQRMGELRDQFTRPTASAPRQELVRAVDHQASRCLANCQALCA